MEERTLRVLEFTKIRARLSEYTKSDLGKERCLELIPTSSLVQAQRWQEETEEAVMLYTRSGGSPIPSFDDARPALSRASVGGVLSLRELLNCAGLMRASRITRSALMNGEDTPHISGQVMALTITRDTEDRITGAILSEDEVSDNASPELAHIRRQMRLCAERVREKLNQMVRSTSVQKYLMDSIVTLRGDRYVLPVKQEYRGNVPGLIHDQSASGATLFIEPMAVVEINNDLKEWVGKEQAEIERILADLSARIAPEADALRTNLGVLAHLDFLFAKAALSRGMRACQPKLNDQGYVNIIRGRHPLLNPDTVVPSTLWLGKDFTSLIITGPNTGGKTVTLKTVGLLSLMAASGLQVPADFGTQMAIFDNVFADIGDEQSIEQSLSTFSSHMTNIVHILDKVTPKSLALFDELGAGTDPTEGAALAMAILGHLLSMQVRAVATTHYSELKAYALTQPGVENASVEFNVETLRPTYRLSIGVPGKSNAFEIANRLGLSDDLIEKARTLLSREQIQFEDVISNAEYHRQVAERERQLAEEASAETLRLRDEADALRQKMEAQKQEFTRKAREDARRLIRQAQAQSEQIIGELKKAQQLTQADQTRLIQNARKTLDHALGDMGDRVDTKPKAAPKPLTEVKEGDEVIIADMNAPATVLSKPDAKGEVQVQAGIMKIKVPLASLQKATPDKKPKSTKRSTALQLKNVSLELDVRGCALDEALPEVDKYLDDMVLSGIQEVSIIHGKGTGVLRTGIQTHLRRHPQVESFRDGKFGEGESGVTVITLK